MSACYVAFRACGCCVAACLDTADKDTADFCSEQILSGLTIERKPTEWVRDNLRPCTHDKSPAHGEML